MQRKFFLFSFFVVVCAFDFYGMHQGDPNLNIQLVKTQENIPITDISFGTENKEISTEEQIFQKKNIKKENYQVMTQYYSVKSDMSSENNTTLFQKKGQEQNEKEMKIIDFLNNSTYSEQINKYPFAKSLTSTDKFVSLWRKDFDEVICNEGICQPLPKEDRNDFKTFLEFYFCHKIIENGEDIIKCGPFLSDNKGKFKDFLEEDIHLFRKKVSLARRFKLHELLRITDEEKANYCNDEYTLESLKGLQEGYRDGVIALCQRNGLINIETICGNKYMSLYRAFVLKKNNDLNKLFVRDLLPGYGESFTASIIKYRTLLFRFIPTFIYNIFDLGRFLKDSYTYSNDGRYSLSFYNVPLILGKTSPLFFNIFQVDFFFNFPLGIFLSCLDFCAYSILRGNLTHKEKDKFHLFQRIFLVWRPFVSDDVDISFISEKSEKEKFEKEECYSAFASVVLKVLTNFVGVNFNIKVKGNYFFSINLMSFVDDFILREYFLDSFNYFNKDLRPSSWSIFYVLDNREVNKL